MVVEVGASAEETGPKPHPNRYLPEHDGTRAPEKNNSLREQEKTSRREVGTDLSTNLKRERTSLSYRTGDAEKNWNRRAGEVKILSANDCAEKLFLTVSITRRTSLPVSIQTNEVRLTSNRSWRSVSTWKSPSFVFYRNFKRIHWSGKMR